MMSYPIVASPCSQTQTINMASVSSSSLPFFTPKTSNLYNKSCFSKSNFSTLTCKASSSSSFSSSMLDFDLYDLLGIDSSCDQSQIKTAYRSLQKRCHPDVAGPSGHDMAIILNDAYAILSDPFARLAYDKEHAKITEFKGFTGKPTYSVWCGSESEEKAVFVDEVKCVGCLKCALIAEKTFAIESVYGRARVVSQWADSEQKIDEAIQACPVNCISVVERSNLAALEFLMSKQPRGNVRVGASNTAGARVSNIFVDVEKFQTRFQQTMEKASKYSKETDLQRESRMSAIQAIRSISNWLYWHPHSASVNKSITRVVHKLPDPNLNKLRDAAAKRKLRDSNKTNNQTPLNSIHREEYWTPSTFDQTSTITSIITTPTPIEKASFAKGKKQRKRSDVERYENEKSPIRWGLPIVTSLIGMAGVRLHEVRSTVELKEHLGGSLALEIVNSSWLQYVLVAATWYMIGLVVVEFVANIGNRNR
ncbi:chaperone protein dnaJ C76, chloroplastic-like [Vicia villosa]|uniref:chaperone protein dnaJ C76, chloroplastic-like n=1 Tax=Vicia villosa TaxID=3911 RepID=UPI00273B7724|nr:chaperone protein dnaJ C76, chloroplastic-like [Vicia villosa]